LWEGRGTIPTVEYTFCMERGMRTINFVHKRIISIVKRVDFVNDRIAYIILRGHWFHLLFQMSMLQQKNAIFWMLWRYVPSYVWK
jgi:hypothetical protein